ncbi:hypothetical protein SAMN05444000_10853 [Shimia gijangensis]|uniref:CENP-V/GFA domain-containing protein n=1 Tax=Shimia gijangensis TaxID=1470563 RepID=A0A1M6IYW4_9RHOB|nr:DUF6151 family protein [Shimia gijangensis]SHJ39639.1 hypothetical protein SAMN05444000_10853 [Shimia gijangensis]
MTDVILSCKCGTLTGVLHDVSAQAGTQVGCYCKDCQANARFLDARHVLDARGGTFLFQTLPSKLELRTGQEHLACLRLSPKGLLRWYADCCDTPMFNTLTKPSLPFVGVLCSAMVDPKSDAAIGPVVAMNAVECAAPGPEALTSFGISKAIWRFLTRAVFAKLRRDRATPFFQPDGSPAVTPKILTLEERRIATPD